MLICFWNPCCTTVTITVRRGEESFSLQESLYDADAEKRFGLVWFFFFLFFFCIWNSSRFSLSYSFCSVEENITYRKFKCIILYMLVLVF